MDSAFCGEIAVNGLIDNGLRSLGTRHPAGALDGLEADVWARIEARSKADVFGGHMVRAQVAVTALALGLGFLMADFAGGRTAPVPSEISVLSDHIAPSILLEGGA
jgi:hypothetical protein